MVVDPELLGTLPPREFRSGIYEIIKYGVIGDARLFDFLERNMQKVLRRERAALAFVIERSIAQKARVVSQDEREAGLREILNFGHTSHTPWKAPRAIGNICTAKRWDGE